MQSPGNVCKFPQHSQIEFGLTFSSSVSGDDAGARQTQYWSRDPNFLGDATPPSRASVTAFMPRKGRSRGKGEWKKGVKKQPHRWALFIARGGRWWILCESNSFESPMRAELARALSSVSRDRFEINQRFRTVDLPPPSSSPLFPLLLVLSL